MKKFLLTAMLGLVLSTLLSLLIAPTSDAARDARVVRVREGDYEILPEKSSDYALDVTGGGDARKETLIELYERNGTDAQIFTIERVDGEWYRIVHKRTGYVVNVAGGHDKNSAQIQIYKDDGTDSCYWRFIDAGDGSYIIQSKLSGHRIIDLSNSKARSGGTIQIWDYHDKDAGHWKLVYESRRSNSGYGSHRGGHGRYGGYDDDDDDYYDRRVSH